MGRHNKYLRALYKKRWARRQKKEARVGGEEIGGKKAVGGQKVGGENILSIICITSTVAQF
jgi:hypothetical protein